MTDTRIMEVGGTNCPVHVFRMPHERMTFVTITFPGV